MTMELIRSATSGDAGVQVELVGRALAADEQDTNQSRWPTDPVWRVVQSATFQEAPAEARRLIRRRQRGAEVKTLDDVQFGCMISRTAKLHPEGGQWTLSRALGEVSGSLEAIETKKTLAGKDFGELVRERRRQFGLPLPIADKVLPFRPASPVDPVGLSADDLAMNAGEVGSRVFPPAAETDVRVAEAWGRLADAELAGGSRHELEGLEAAYHAEVKAYEAALARVTVRVDGDWTSDFESDLRERRSGATRRE